MINHPLGSIILLSPFITSAVWVAIAELQLARGRYHLLQDKLFLSLSIMMIVLTIVDPVFLYFLPGRPMISMIAAKLDLSVMSLLALFVVLANKVYISDSGNSEQLIRHGDRLDISNILSLASTGAVIALIWTGPVLLGIDYPKHSYLLTYQQPVYHPLISIFIAHLALLTAIGCYYLYGLFMITRNVELTTKKSSQLRVLFWAFLLMLLSGLLSNTINIVLDLYNIQPATPPLFTSLLIIPSMILIVSFSQPCRHQKLTSHVLFALYRKRLPQSSFKIEDCFLLSHDGQLLEKKGVRPNKRNRVQRRFTSASEREITRADKYILATLHADATIEERRFGNASLLVQTGRGVTLVLVLSGSKNADLAEIARLVVKWLEERYGRAFETGSLTHAQRADIGERLSELYDDPSILNSNYEDTVALIKTELAQIGTLVERYFARPSAPSQHSGGDSDVNGHDRIHPRAMAKKLAAALESDRAEHLHSCIIQLMSDLERLERKEKDRARAHGDHTRRALLKEMEQCLIRADEMYHTLPHFTLRALNATIVKGRREEIAVNITNEGKYELTDISIVLAPADHYIIEDGSVHIAELTPGITQRIYFSVIANILDRIQLPTLVTYRSSAEDKKHTRMRPLVVESVADASFKPIKNPYSPGQPIENEEMFFGRKRELEHIFEAVTNGSKIDVLLIGQRRAGKTTMLNHLSRKLHQRCSVVSFDSQTTQFKEPCQLTRFIIDHLPIELDEMTRQELMDENDLFYLNDLLNEMLSHRLGRVVLLIDEGELLWQFGGDPILLLFRGMLQNNPSLACVMAGTEKLLEMRNPDNRFSPFFNAFLPTRIGALEEKDARELLTEPISADYFDDSLETVIALTGGNPYLLQSYGYNIVTILNAKREYRVTPDDVERATARILRHEQHHIGKLWDQLDAPERDVVTTLAQNGGRTSLATVRRELETENEYPPRIVHNALASLIDREILAKHRSPTTIASGGFAEVAQDADRMEIVFKIGFMERWLQGRLSLLASTRQRDIPACELRGEERRRGREERR